MYHAQNMPTWVEDTGYENHSVQPRVASPAMEGRDTGLTDLSVR